MFSCERSSQALISFMKHFPAVSLKWTGILRATSSPVCRFNALNTRATPPIPISCGSLYFSSSSAGNEAGIVGDLGMMIVSPGDPGYSFGETELKNRDSHLAIAAPASAQEKMMTRGLRRPAGVLIRASVATNTPTSENSRWPDAVHFSDLERSVPVKRAVAERAR